MGRAGLQTGDFYLTPDISMQADHVSTFGYGELSRRLSGIIRTKQISTY